MTAWLLTIWLATGEAVTLTQPYADEAACRIAARIVEDRARILHALRPADTVAVAWVTCGPRPAIE